MKFTKYIIFIFIIPIYCQFGKNIVQYKTFDWHYIQSQYFDIYYYDTDTHATTVALESQNAYNIISNAIGWKLKNRVPIIIYNSHNDFQQTNIIDMYMPEGVGGVTELYKNRVVIPYDGSNIKFKNVFYHELVHAFINDYIYKGGIKNMQNQDIILVPLWMNEGLAEFLSSNWNSDSDMWIRDLVINGDRLPKLNELNGYLAYRGGQSVWKFIVENLDTAYINKETQAPTIIASIFSAIATSSTLDEALKKSIDMGIEDLEEQWHKYLKSEYWPDINNRQYITDIAVSLIDYKKVNSNYNIAPSISPDGNKIAYYSNKNGLMSICIISSDCDNCNEKSIEKILTGGMSIEFEELHTLKPGISWSSDSNKIILSSTSKGEEVLFIIDLKSGKKQKIEFKAHNLTSISQPIWNPVLGNLVAFIGSNHIQSDVYLYNFETEGLSQLTDDIFTDQEISWTTDGQAILFSSDRGGEIENYQYDLYSITLNSNKINQLTHTEHNEHHPISIYSDSLIICISDQNGINNIHIFDYNNQTTKKTNIITNTFTGITQITAKDNNVFFTSLNENRFGLYKLDTSVIINHKIDSLNMFKMAKWKNNIKSYDFTLLKHSLDKKLPDYRNYIFDLYPPNLPIDSSNSDSIVVISEEERKDSLGNYITHKYKTKFSLDVGQFSVGVGLNNSNNNYTQNGMAVFQFSDVMGDHKIYLGTELDINFKRSDYAFVYRYLPKIIDWGVLFSHDGYITLEAEEIEDGQLFQYQNLYQNIVFGLNASRPLSRFNKFDLNINHYLMLINEEKVNTTIYNGVVNSNQIYSGGLTTLNLRYIWDNTRWFYTYPINGSRFYLKYKTAPLKNYDINLITFDGRFYRPLFNGISFLFRNFSGHTWGRDNQAFYLGSEPSFYTSNPNAADYYMDHYQNNSYDDLMIFFNFSENISPIRGTPFMYKYGDNVALFNFELRAPVLLYYFPAIKWVGQINGVAFLDVGVVWNNNTQFPKFSDEENWVYREEDATKTQGWVMSYGWGPRFIFLGLPWKINYAWQYNPITNKTSDRRYEITIGFDL